jgi:putative ATP-dependent endonuclease of OLD family
VTNYASSAAEVNRRNDGSWAVQTTKYEIENYLHTDAILDAFGVQIVIPDYLDVNGNALPRVFSLAYSASQNHYGVRGDNKTKHRLAEKAFPCMTADRIHARDPAGEVEEWFYRIGEMF